MSLGLAKSKTWMAGTSLAMTRRRGSADESRYVFLLSLSFFFTNIDLMLSISSIFAPCFFMMKLNPAPPDPTQKMIFDWMPLIFTFMLASFSAGLVIYWAWNNSLSVLQQSIIMKKNGAKIELLDNIKAMFVKKAPDKDSKKT